MKNGFTKVPRSLESVVQKLSGDQCRVLWALIFEQRCFRRDQKLTNGKVVTLDSDEFAISTRNLAARLDVGHRTVRSTITRLQAENILLQRNFPTYTVFKFNFALTSEIQEEKQTDNQTRHSRSKKATQYPTQSKQPNPTQSLRKNSQYNQEITSEGSTNPTQSKQPNPTQSFSRRSKNQQPRNFEKADPTQSKQKSDTHTIYSRIEVELNRKETRDPATPESVHSSEQEGGSNGGDFFSSFSLPGKEAPTSSTAQRCGDIDPMREEFPEIELADQACRLFESAGRAPQKREDWTAIFKKMLCDSPAQEIGETLEWAFDNPYWRENLKSHKHFQNAFSRIQHQMFEDKFSQKSHRKMPPSLDEHYWNPNFSKKSSRKLPSFADDLMEQEAAERKARLLKN